MKITLRKIGCFWVLTVPPYVSGLTGNHYDGATWDFRTYTVALGEAVDWAAHWRRLEVRP